MVNRSSNNQSHKTGLTGFFSSKPQRASAPKTVQRGYVTYESFDDDAAAQLSSAQPEHDPNLLLGRYVPQGQAGQGGFGSVVVAWDPTIERQVAIKCLPLEGTVASQGSILLDSQSVDVSAVPGLEEARTAAKLSDSSIVQVYDFQVEGDTAYLIMEYVDGTTLSDLLRDCPDGIDANVVAAVFRAVAHALQVAHKHHVLHLDVKPDNVLIDRAGHVKVTDFGLAKLANEAGYGAAEGGTIGYMPPEQMNQRPLDQRCDEWALASLTYEMMSGKNPFLANDLSAAEDAIYDAELVIPSLCMPGFDDAVDDVMFRALDPDVEKRYPTVAEFAAELQPCLGGYRKGANTLKRLLGEEVQPEAEEEYDEDEGFEPAEPRQPWRPSPWMRQAGKRLWAAAEVAILATVSIGAMGAPGAWDKPAAWGVLAGLAVLAALLPRVGVLVALEALGVALCLCGGPILGAAMIVVTAGWWYLACRHSDEAANAGALPALLGAINFTPFSPFVAGFFLYPLAAAASAAYAWFLAVVLAGLGSGSLMRWPLLSLSLSNVGAYQQDLVAALLSNPETWITGAAWVIGAFVAGMLCRVGKRSVNAIGMAIAGALIIASVVLNAAVGAGGSSLYLDPANLAPAIVAAIAGVALPCFAEPPSPEKLSKKQSKPAE